MTHLENNPNLMVSDLIHTPYKIIQLKGHAYNLDSILISHFIKVTKDIKTLYDFGTGQAVILMYLSLKTKAKLVGYEIQKELVEIAKHNIETNGLKEQIEIIEQDIKTLRIRNVDCIVSNPPYFELTDKVKKASIKSRAKARHEIDMNLETLFQMVSKSLRPNGTFYLIHRANRLDEIMSLSKTFQLIPKRIQLVHPYMDKEATQVLVKCVKGASSDMIIEPPIILYDDKHVLSETLKKIYQGEDHHVT